MSNLFLWVPLLSFLLLQTPLNAKVYYINKGVKYHIGDNRFSQSEDSEFLDAYPSVGQEWIQAFQVSVSDTVKVHIDKIWGVDDCPYCKIIISIDDFDMLRLSKENNHQPVDTLEPLARMLQPGVTHYLKIASYGNSKVDDFMIQDVSVESQTAEIKLLEPGPILKAPLDPLPVFAAPKLPPAVSLCGQAPPKQGWFPKEGTGRFYFGLASPDRNPKSSGKLTELSPGEALEFYARVDAVEPGGALFDHALELLVEGPSRSGWVLNFNPSSTAPEYCNSIVEGNYRSARFNLPAFKSAAWNRVKIEFCADGKVLLLVNGSNTGQSIDVGRGPKAFVVRTLGIKAAFSADGVDAPPMGTNEFGGGF